jgi:flagellar protein FlgJ
VTTPIGSASTYGDFAGLEALKKAVHGDDPAAIRQVAKQFESLFARMMIKSMRDAVGRDPIFGSDQEQTYQEMYDDQLSIEVTRGHGLGLADMLVRQLQHKGIAAAGNGEPGHGAASAKGFPLAGRGTGAARVGALQPASRGAVAHGLNPPSASSEDRKSFIRDVWPQARQAAQQLGVAPQNLVAQAALETDWGRKVPRDAAGRSSNNLFGIKATDDWEGSSVSDDTREFQGGAAHAATAQFRAYGNPAQSFQDYVALLKGSPRYAAALNTGHNVQAFASALQRGGYATDPDYARKVSAVASDVASALSDPSTAVRAPGPSAEPIKFSSAAPIAAGVDSLL